MNIHEENRELLQILDKAELTDLQARRITQLNDFIDSKKNETTGFDNMLKAGLMNVVLGNIVKELESKCQE